ncbi:MAG: TIGR00341 family protein [Sedimenticola sp.]|nr:TIGR00341 family protein [Sedimenticola sp.]
MKYLEIVAAATSADTISAIAKKGKAEDCRLGMVGEDGMQQMRLLVTEEKLQWVLDALQHVLGAQPTARILILSVEASLPRKEEKEGEKKAATTAAREALYHGVEKNARLDTNYIVLVLLSTIVAAIGLIENNVAVVIGAMVIAPLLGPNLALSLGIALGDIPLVKESIKTLLVGTALAVLISIGVGYFWLTEPFSEELLARTVAGLDSAALALASGAAAALSLTTGLSSVLVGVMVAVALLPPAATAGLMLGYGDIQLAIGAALLLAVNIVCVNLASKLVFVVKGIYPRTWVEKEKAKRATVVYVIGWVVLLVILLLIIFARESLIQ